MELLLGNILIQIDFLLEFAIGIDGEDGRLARNELNCYTSVLFCLKVFQKRLEVRVAVQLSPTARDDLARESFSKGRCRKEEEGDDEEDIAIHC